MWLTPVLTSPEIASALVNARTAGLLVGGTADELWDGEVARRSGLDVHQVDDADHILYTAGDWQRSFEELGRTLEAVQRFAGQLAGRAPLAAPPPSG